MTAPGAPAAMADAAADPAPRSAARRPLGDYTDPAGRRRELVARPAGHGSRLVIDEDAATLGDRRLVAHLGRDEPAGNAALVARLYLADPAGRFARPVEAADWRRHPGAGSTWSAPASSVLVDARRRAYRLAVRTAPWGAGELRWTRTEPDDATVRTVGVRDVVGALEAYEPACAITQRALDTPPDPLVSTDALAAELARLRGGRTVLNVAVRAAVQAAAADGLSLSQIAVRCGHAKSRREPHVGDTSWLGRRIGLLPETGCDEPSPWIHSDVLAVVARDGLGLDPRQVESA